ncbi:MAG: hypothetical protein WCR67_01960 [Bacilli bacterium]
MEYNDTQYEKDRKVYGYLASLPIVIALVHLAGFIALQSLISYDAATQSFSGTGALGVVFSFSSFSAILASASENIGLIKALPAVISIVEGLMLMFLSSQAVKGKHLMVSISFYLYLADTIVLIPTIILSLLHSYPLAMSVTDIIVSVLIHALLLAAFIYLYIISERLKKFETVSKEENSGESVYRK